MSYLKPEPAGLAVSHERDRSKLLWAGNTVFDLVLDGSQTGGAVALLDQWGSRGDTTPMHIHHDEAEIFYILEGSVVAWSGADAIELGAGGAVYLPAERPHAFGIRSDRARLITVTVPAGFAGFVRSAGIPVTGDVPQQWEFDLGRLMGAAPQHGIEIVGPPPALPEL